MTIRLINRVLKYGVLICTFAFVASVLLQIFARFFLSNTPAWTEEASRLFFIYAIAFSAGIAVKDGYYVSLEYFFNKFPDRLRNRVEKAILVLNSLLFAVITIYAFQFVGMGTREYAPSMSIPMSVAFFSMVIMFASLCFYSIRQFIKMIKG
jgi:TRAP-type transport system small permease protein